MAGFWIGLAAGLAAGHCGLQRPGRLRRPGQRAVHERVSSAPARSWPAASCLGRRRDPGRLIGGPFTRAVTGVTPGRRCSIRPPRASDKRPDSRRGAATPPRSGAGWRRRNRAPRHRHRPRDVLVRAAQLTPPSLASRSSFGDYTLTADGRRVMRRRERPARDDLEDRVRLLVPRPRDGRVRSCIWARRGAHRVR